MFSGFLMQRITTVVSIIECLLPFPCSRAIGWEAKAEGSGARVPEPGAGVWARAVCWVQPCASWGRKSQRGVTEAPVLTFGSVRRLPPWPGPVPVGTSWPEAEIGTLRPRYQPPNLAISTLYWKAWPLLLVVAAFNPENIGEPPLAGHGPLGRC